MVTGYVRGNSIWKHFRVLRLYLLNSASREDKIIYQTIEFNAKIYEFFVVRGATKQ